MPEIISFARPIATSPKDRLKKSENSGLPSKKLLPDLSIGYQIHQAPVTDSVHFSGTNNKKRKHGELKPGDGLKPQGTSGGGRGPNKPESISDPDDDGFPPPPRRGGRQDFGSLLPYLMAGIEPTNSKPPTNPGAHMAKNIKPYQAEDSEWEAYKEVGVPYADKLSEIAERPYLNNAVLKSDDVPLKQAILMNLKEKLGLKPMFAVDCAPDKLEALTDHYEGSVLPNIFAEPAHTMGLPSHGPTVLLLNNASADEAESLQRKEAFQRIKKQNPHFRFVIGQAHQPEGGEKDPFQMMLSRAKAKSTDTRPAPFETVDVKPLNTAQWSRILHHDPQARAILDHWKLAFHVDNLKLFLDYLQKGKPPLDRDQIMGELDSLASFVRIRNKDNSPEITALHVMDYTKKMHGASSAVVKAPEGLSSNPMEQKPYKIIKAKDIKIRLDDVVGHKRAKQVLSQALEAIKYPALYAHLNEGDEDAQNNHVLLMGEPGGGKTMLAKAVAGEGKGTFISSSGSQFVNVYVGMGANNMRQLKAAIEQAPDDLAVVFIDEIDSLGNRAKSSSETGGSREETQTINEFLSITEGLSNSKKKVLLIGATNRPEALDEAILSRFHHKIDMKKLDGEQRKVLLGNQMKQKKLESDGSVDLDELVKLTEGFSGRDLRNVMKMAKEGLIHQIPVEEKEKLERNSKARKAFQLQVSQEALVKSLNEIKAGWKNVNKSASDSPPPFGMYN